MEGPSLHLAAEQLQHFVGRRIDTVRGNSKIGIERLQGLTVKDIFAWGKHLVFQFDTFALRVHFMLWGTFAAAVDGKSVTGDYRRAGPPRLVLDFPNGDMTIWAASVKFIEEADAKASSHKSVRKGGEYLKSEAAGDCCRHSYVLIPFSRVAANVLAEKAP